MIHKNAQLLLNTYAAFANGDPAPLFASLLPSIRWNASGGSPIAGEYNGVEEVMGFFDKMFRLYEGNLQLKVISILADDSAAAVLTDESIEYKGKKCSFKSVHVWKFEGGKLAEFRVFNDDSYNLFWPVFQILA